MDGTTALVVIVLALIAAEVFGAWINRNKPDCDCAERDADE